MVIETATLDTWDIVTICVYFAIVMAVGLIATWRANRGSSAGFFLAGKSMTWLPIAGSIFATNMGAPTLVGLAGSGAAVGFAPIMFEWHATYMLVILGWIFVPIYFASGTFTIPGYLSKRFGGKRLRVYFAIVQIVLSILTGISAEIYAGAMFIQQILGWDLYLSTVLILVITSIYTIGGGLAAVIYTDALQTGIMIIGTVVLAVLALDRVGGYEALLVRYEGAVANTTYLTQALHGNLSCGLPPDDAFHIMRGLDSAYPWPGLTLGLTLLAAYYFCANQTIVQRNLAAKNLSHSKAACVLASYLKLLPFALFLLPGMVSRVLFPDEVACADPDVCKEICDNSSGCSDLAFPLLVLRLLPTGLRGLMLATLLSCLMSSLTSIFNSTSSVFCMDIWANIRRKPSDREIVVVGRIFGVILIGCSIGWLPVLTLVKGSQLWDYLQSISSYITPSWIVVILMGMFWQRATEQGAWWGLMAGLVTGIIRMAVHFAYPTPKCGSTEPDTRPDVFTSVHYLHFAIILALITFFVSVCVSYITKPRPPHKLRRVTWWTRGDPKQPELSDDEDEEDEPTEKDRDNFIYEEPTGCKKVWAVVCGFNKPPEPKMTKEEREEMEKKLTDIEEDPLWSQVCNINAVIAIAATCFIIGFYA